MTQLVLRLFGDPVLELSDGSTIQVAAASKSLALLAFLALEPGKHSREQLTTLLWGESAEGTARDAFRQMLKRLRDLLGDALLVDRHTVGLSPAVSCDVARFLSAVEHDPETAANFEVPRFLHDFTVRHSPAFDEWAAGQRHQLLTRYHRTLAALVREAIAHWHWRDAVAWAGRWLTSDPCSDEAARLGIEAVYLSGDREGALAKFDEHRDRLVRETGTGPSPPLAELARRIRTDLSESPQRPISDEWYARGTFEGSLVGREAHWATLLKAWRSTVKGSGRVALVEGEAGVGKTRLAEEFLRWATAEGNTVLRGRGFAPQSGTPYGPVVELLRDALTAPGVAGTDHEWLIEVARLIPELRRKYPALEGTGPAPAVADRWRLFEGVAQLILSAAAERPVVLFVDDLQWCDGETCALVHFLMRRLSEASVLLLVTLTLGELERDAHPARLCRALRSQAGAAVLSLESLDEEQIWQMIREMGRIQAPTGARRLAARIHLVSGGNPFYAIELLKTLFAQGGLAVNPESGEWILAQGSDHGGGQEFPLSRTVRDAIAERVERLAYELRDLLVTLSVAGLGGRPELLSQVHGISRLHAAALCDALVERRLVEEKDGRYRPAHPVIAEVVVDSVTASRRREVHRAIALALNGTTPPADAGEVAGEIARHAEAGGEMTLAYGQALLASQSASERLAFEEALSWLDLAERAAQPGPEADAVNRRTADLLERAGWSEPPRPARMPKRRGSGIEREDLDLEGAEAT